MDYQTSLNFLLSFLGGGLVGAILNWARIARSERQKLKAERIKIQLEKLYGPLFYITSQAEKIHHLLNRHYQAYDIEYIGEKGSCSEGFITAIEISNQYAKVLSRLANQATKVMQEAYAYIDPVDSEQFQTIVVDTIRMDIEHEETGKLLTPIEIYQHVGDIHFFRREFIDLVKQRFIEKQAELIKFEK
ncbi:MAG: hypothetical protein ACRDC6_14055 [Shewanella sp.]